MNSMWEPSIFESQTPPPQKNNKKEMSQLWISVL